MSKARPKPPTAAPSLFGQLLTRLRVAKWGEDFSSRDIERELKGGIGHVTHVSILRYESGERRPGLLALARIAHVYGVSAEGLIAALLADSTGLARSVDELEAMAYAPHDHAIDQLCHTGRLTSARTEQEIADVVASSRLLSELRRRTTAAFNEIVRHATAILELGESLSEDRAVEHDTSSRSKIAGKSDR